MIALRFASTLALLLAGSSAAADPYITGDPTLYPKPTPVETVKRLPRVTRHDSLARVAADAPALAQAANRAVRIEVLKVVRGPEIGGEPVGEGWEAITLVTRWIHVLPRQKVERAALEGKADRTMGAGGLFGGAATGPRELVEVDVPYQIPDPGEHLYLAADGLAETLDPAGAKLPDGLPLHEPFTLTRPGDTRVRRLAFRVPEGTSNLALRFFDNSYGSITVAVHGDAAAALDAVPAGMIDRARIGTLELATAGMEFRRTYGDVTAPDGWHFAAVRLLGRGAGAPGAADDRVRIDPTRFVWLSGDGGALWYALPPADGQPTLSFTPDLFQRQEAVFLIPEEAQRLRLGLRDRSGAATLAATTGAPAPMPPGVVEQADGSSLRVAVFGARWEGSHVVLDLGLRPAAGGNEGLEADSGRQFLLLSGSQEIPPDAAMSRRLSRRGPDPLVVPPGTPLRFELAYALPAGATPDALRFLGFAQDLRLDLSGLPVTGTRGQPSAAGLTAFPKIARPTPVAPPVGAPPPAGPAPAAPPAGIAAHGSMQAVELPPYDPSRAGEDQEPNSTFDRAQPLGPDLSIRGTLSPADPDYLFFDVDEPGMWVLEAQGAGVARAAYVDATRWPQSERAMEPGSDTLWLDNLYLAPGRHWIALHGTQAGGDYVLRAVRLGAPTAGDEREPNNDATRANVLRPGQRRTGLIAHTQDRDFYRFDLEVASHVSLRLERPPESKLQLRLDGGPRALLMGAMAAPGEPVAYQAALPPGEYQVQVSSDGASKSRTPYVLTLDLQDPFRRPADLEPNDWPGAASELGRVRVFDGHVGETGDADWFALPPLDVETALEIRLSSDGNHAQASLKRGVGKGTQWETLQEDYQQRSERGHVYLATLQAAEAYLLNVAGRGPYHLELRLTPDPVADAGPDEATAPELTVGTTPPRFAAFRAEAQHTDLPIRLYNPGPVARDYRLEAWASSEAWTVELPDAPLRLATDEARDLTLRVAANPDLPATDAAALYLRAVASDGAASSSRDVPLSAACSALPLSATPYRPVPDILRGGINVARQALGAEPMTGGVNAAPLFDGHVALGGEWRAPAGALPAEAGVRLAGDAASPIAGVAITPAGGNQAPLGPFVILTSTDGETFTEALRGRLRPGDAEQYFSFQTPVPARVVKLRLEAANPIEPQGEVALRELKVIAAPGGRPLGNAPNIAAPVHGGHVVRALPQAGSYRNLEAMLTEAEERPTLVQGDPQWPLEWVIGFHHDRAARITALEWREQASAPAGQRITHMEVWTSVDSPLGPWRSLGVWNLGVAPGETATLRLESPQWARYLRFRRSPGPGPATWLLPETLRILEQPAEADYRSILGEWGLYARAAAYEEQAPPPAAARPGADAGDEPSRALALSPGTPHRDQVSIGADEDWYEIEVPEGDNRLELVLGGPDAGRVTARLTDAGGVAVPVTEQRTDDGGRVLLAEVAGGERYRLQVTEPPRSIMVAWDNSGSVGPYRPAIYRALEQFFDDIQPGTEQVNLLPFRDRDVRTLVEDWTDDPRVLRRALNDYDRADGSSNAEASLLGALQALDDQPGNRAVVLITDAASNGFDRSAELWQALDRLRPGIFTLELHLQEQNVAHNQDLMQDWSATSQGRYAWFRTQADLDRAFARAACLMRRPADYTLTVTPRYETPPEPGALLVQWEKGKAAAGASVELILDASGSMRSRKHLIDGRLKMDVAKDVLRGVIAELPDDARVGLRAYGHRIREGQPGDCTDSELMVDVAPLDRPRLLAQVEALEALGTTAIAYSLEQAASDFAGVDGPKMILLVTDGEEECAGDPAATAERLRGQGLDVQVNVAGFALADPAVKAAMETMAAAGGGSYFDAEDTQGLASAIRSALAVPFDLVNHRGEVVVSGTTGDQPVSAPPGRYTLEVHTVDGDVPIPDVEIRSATSRRLILRRDGERIDHAFE